jgi:hypothetical protein
LISNHALQRIDLLRVEPQPGPGRQLSPVAKVVGVGGRGHQCADGEHAHTADLLNPLRRFTALGVGVDPRIALINVLIQLSQVLLSSDLRSSMNAPRTRCQDSIAGEYAVEPRASLR